MTKPRRQQIRNYFAAGLWGLASLLPVHLNSQEAELQDSIGITSNALQELDQKASACLDSPDTNTGTDTNPACDEFLSALDGEFMANYLRHCASLKSWRDSFVQQTIDSDDEIENSESIVKSLVSIEFNCGENAVRTRTEFVSTAFELLAGGRNSQLDLAVSQRLTQLEFNIRENRERQRLINSLREQSSGSLLDPVRQPTPIENEVIRQQIRNIGRPN